MKMKIKNVNGLEIVKRQLGKWLYFHDMDVLRVLLATVIANRMDGDPLWLFIIGPPSSAKTELIAPLAGLDFIYPLSSLTPQTFASGYVADDDASLLSKLKSNTIITFKDFTSILTTVPSRLLMIVLRLSVRFS